MKLDRIWNAFGAAFSETGRQVRRDIRKRVRAVKAVVYDKPHLENSRLFLEHDIVDLMRRAMHATKGGDAANVLRQYPRETLHKIAEKYNIRGY